MERQFQRRNCGKMATLVNYLRDDPQAEQTEPPSDKSLPSCCFPVTNHNSRFQSLLSQFAQGHRSRQ